MKINIFFIVLFFFSYAYAEDEGSNIEPSSFIAIVDVNVIRRDSVFLHSMYDEANALSENLQHIIDQLQEDSRKDWENINQNINTFPVNERDILVEKNRLTVQAKERFIVSRRIEIENAVSRVDNQIKDELINHIIQNYAVENGFKIILRNTQVIYSQLPDITQDVLEKLNDSDIVLELGLKPLDFDNVIADIRETVDSRSKLPSVVSPNKG